MKIVKKLVCLLMLAVLCTSTWCDDGDAFKFVEITFFNESTENVFVSELALLDNDVLYYTDISAVSKNKTSKYYCICGNPFYLYVYKQSTIDKYSRKDIVENNICDKIFVFSYEELEAMNFKIVYTGND